MKVCYWMVARYIAVLVVLWGTTLAADELSSEARKEASDRFIAVGQLASTKSADGDSIVYVLLDDKGEILNRLQPNADLDLSRHLGEEVGITAQLLHDGDVPLLLAQQVTTFAEANNGVLNVPAPLGDVTLAAYQEELPPSMPVPSETLILESGEILYGPSVTGTNLVGDFYSGGCGNVDCSSCAASPYGYLGNMWIRAEYLLWWTDGMDTPALVTTSPLGTVRDEAGVLGENGTSILFGDRELLEGSRSGGRFRLGTWCDSCQRIGFETEVFFLGDKSDDYHNSAIGQQILGRPFFNTELQENDSELIQFPGEVVGAIHIETETSLWSVAPRFRLKLACETIRGCGICNDCGRRDGYRFDLLLGYRYTSLEEMLSVRDNRSTLDTTNQTLFDRRDSFETSNDFHGGDIGFLWEGYRGPWSLELIGRCALGNNHEKVNISGSTRTTASGTTLNDPGGLLALTSNIGSYSRDKFAIIPEFSATLGYAVSACSRLTVGYTFLYWNEVVRAGDHINLNVNPNLIPPVQPLPGAANPTFAFDDTSFWAQGLNVGLDYRW